MSNEITSYSVGTASRLTPRGKSRATLATAGGAHFIHDGFSDTLFVLLPLWAEQFGLSLTQVGFLKSAYSGTMAAGQIPAGFVAERIGERLPLAIGTVAAGLGFVFFGLAGGFLGLFACLVLTGLGSSTQHPLASSLVARAFASGGRRAALGTYNFAGDLGKIVVPASIAGMTALLGWQMGAGLYGAAAIGGGVLLFLVLGLLGAGMGATKTDRPSPEEMVSNDQKGWGILSPPGFTILSVISMIDSAARIAFLTFIPFLLIGKGIEAVEVGFALLLVFIGGAAGKLICGFVAERLGIIRTVVVTEIATAVTVGLVIMLPLTPALFLLPIFGIALNGTSSVLYATVSDLVDQDRQSRAYGLFYTLGTGASAVAPLAFGVVSDVTGVEMTLYILAVMVLLTIPLCVPLGRILRRLGVAS